MLILKTVEYKKESSATIEVKLEPLGKRIWVEPGASLQDVLFEYGVEFPCGGEGSCGNCRIKLQQGDLAVNDVQRDFFTAEEITDGWRLACQCRVREPVTLEIAQWEMQILTDEESYQTAGRSGYAVAVDLGTTTLVTQLLDLATGNVVGTRTGLNPQAQYGSDVMSRVEFGTHTDGAVKLRERIRSALLKMILDLLSNGSRKELLLRRIFIVGNTVMHHLFCGRDVTPLSRAPFETAGGKEFTTAASEIGWDLPGNPEVRFLPCLGGFVGSDILAGIIATGLARETDLTALIDLGTNGEVVIGNRRKILCASTAAGPAFEGAKISRGMRAITGAIAKVTLNDGRQFAAHVLGGGEARGICGSGLVDAVACAIELGLIDETGRITGFDGRIVIQDGVSITQQDIRELQLAKAAVAAGLEILLQRLSVTFNDLKKVYIGGAFGSYISVANARKIGLFCGSDVTLIQAGNTALRGVKELLLREPDYHTLLTQITHIALATDAGFMDRFVANMTFGKRSG
ncbi:MAG: ASKHA domain-containing protein [Fidelibacterota bacterium]